MFVELPDPSTPRDELAYPIQPLAQPLTFFRLEVAVSGYFPRALLGLLDRCPLTHFPDLNPGFHWYFGLVGAIDIWFEIILDGMIEGPLLVSDGPVLASFDYEPVLSCHFWSRPQLQPHRTSAPTQRGVPCIDPYARRLLVDRGTCTTGGTRGTRLIS